MKKILFFLVLASMMSVSIVSAATWDDIKRYDAETKTVRVINALGFGDEIGNATLKTPLINYVIPGKSVLVAEFTVGSKAEYIDALTSMEFFEVNKGNRKVDRQFEYKIKTKYIGIRDVYSQTCSTNSPSINCKNEKIGTESYEYYGWSSFGTKTIPKGEVTIGVFTEVKKNDYVEWIPTLFNQRVEEWAIFASDPALVLAFKFDEGTGTTTNDSISQYNGTFVNTPAWIPGKERNGTRFTVAGNTFITFGDNQRVNITEQNYTTSMWINTTNGSIGAGDVGMVYTTDAGDSRGFSFFTTDTNLYNCRLEMSGGPVDVGTVGFGDNLWHNIVCLRNTTHLSIWVDGTIRAIGAIAGSPDTSNQFRLGERLNGQWNYQGGLDELYIWNKSLTVSDISTLYANGAGTFYPFQSIQSINLTNPTNNSNFTSVSGRTFNATATITTGTAVNATRYLYNSSGGIVNVAFTDFVPNNKSNFSFAFLPALTDGVYTWNVEMCGDDSTCIFAPSNFTFTLDSTNPIVFARSPGNNTYVYPQNMTTTFVNLNISAIDTSLASCSFNSTFSPSLTVTACNVNRQINLTNNFGRHDIRVCANDSLGNEACNTTFIVIPRINYSLSSTVGATETFTFNTSALLGSTLSSVTLVYNGTSYSTTLSSDGGGNTISTRSLIVPPISSNANYTFYWITNDGTNYFSSNYTQAISALSIDNCSVNTNALVNMTVYDEETKIFLPALQNVTIETAFNLYSADRTLSILNTSGSFTNNPLRICLNNNLTSAASYSYDLIVKYDATVYETEYYNIVNSTLNSTSGVQNISLYDLLTADSTEFQLTFTGADYARVPGALVYIDRQYIADNVFRTVELPKTDSNGQTVVHLVRNDIIYNIRIIKDGVLLGNFNNLIAFCEDVSIGNCQINLNGADSVEDIFNYDDDIGIVFSTPTFNSTSRILSFSFTSTDGSSKAVAMNVTRNDIFGNRTICNTQTTSASATLTCTVASNIDESVLNVDILVDGSKVVSGNVVLDEGNYGTIGYVAYFLLALSLILVFSDSKNGILAAIGLSVVGGIGLGLVTGTVVGIGTSAAFMIVVVIIGMWKLNKDVPQ